MTTPTTIEELRAELERVRESVTSLQAQLDLSRQLHKEACGIANETKAELERVNRANAEMREALEVIAGRHPIAGRLTYSEMEKFASDVLTASAGRHYFSREAVLPLVTLIDKLYKMAISETEEVCELNTIWFRRRCAEGLAHARAIGLLKEDA